MKTLTFRSADEAAARSRAEWEKVLGRPKRPEDVTEFLWQVEGPVLRVPAESEMLLSSKELSVLREAVNERSVAGL